MPIPLRRRYRAFSRDMSGPPSWRPNAIRASLDDHHGEENHMTRTTLLATVAALCLGSAPTAQDVTLRVHHFLSADAPIQTGVLEPWEKMVEEQSGGRIDVQ